MDYKKTDGKLYLRIDKDEEILSTVKALCNKENIPSAIFRGIGACGNVCIATYIPATASFLDHQKTGMLELVSLDGNISHDEDGQIYEHAHAMFSYLNKEGGVSFFGGHLKRAIVSYTAEFVIEPLSGDGLGRTTDPYTGITVWKLH